MSPDDRSRPERRPQQTVGETSEHTVLHRTDATWEAIADAWAHATWPRRGSVAYHLLAPNDPVRMAIDAADDLAVTDLVRAHGPNWARLVAEIRSEVAA